MDISCTPDIQVFEYLATRGQPSFVPFAAAFLALLLIPSLSSAAIYKCTAQDGSITYTDEPCPADTTTLYVDPVALASLNESFEGPPALAHTPAQSQPELLAALCANDEFKVWLKAKRDSLPERDVRTAKLIELNNLCRRALHLPVVAAPMVSRN
jgi:hypothetical protein